MPGFDDELMQALGGGSSFDDELGQALGGDDGFKPWTQPGDAGSPLETSGSNSAGSPLWSGDSLDTLADFGARASNGMYMGYGDELAGLVGGDDMRDNIRNRMQLAKERSPTASIAGDIVGGAVPAIGSGGLAAGATRGLPLLERSLGAGFMGSGDAALSASGYADDGDRMAAANEAAPLGFALGGAGEAAASGIQGVGSWMRNTAAPAVRESGLIDRAASTGRGGGAMSKLSDELGGREGVIDAGQWMENNGMTQWSPRKLDENLQDFTSMRQGDQRYFLDDLAENPDAFPVDTGSVADSLQSSANQANSLAPSASKLQGAQYANEAQNLRAAAPSGYMDFEPAWQNRQAYDQGAKWQSGPQGDQGLAAVNREAANGLRGGLRESLDNTSPELGPRWDSIQDDLSNSLSLSGAGEDASMRAAGNAPAPLSLTSLAGAAGGGWGGYASALAVKTGGRGMMADAQGAGSAALDWLGTQGTEPMMSMARGSTQAGANQTGRLVGEPEATRGYLLPQAAQQMMQQPGALGKYESQFWEAYNSPDSNALSALIVRLSHTDPQFKRDVLPQLQQLTAEQR